MGQSKRIIVTGIVAALLGVSGTALASSHREAPAIAEDQFADNTDLYTFISPEDPSRITFVANYVPLLLPSSGPNYYRFSDSVLYEIRVDNNGDAVADLSYQFEFRTSVANDMTFLYNTGAITSLSDTDLNVRQTYTLTRVDLATGARTALATDAPTAPWYVGKRSFTDPGCAGGNPDSCYDSVASAAVTPLTGLAGGKVFAGPRDEPFFVDLHVFDLLGVGGAQTTNGVNVMTIALELPISDLAMGGTRPAATATGPESVIGAYATASRRQVTILRRTQTAEHHGQWVQVSRLGWPLVNEVLIPLRDKDRFNRTQPAGDVGAFGAYVLMPSLPGLINAVLGPSIPAARCAATPAGGRLDVVGLLKAGFVSGLAADVPIVPADLLRIDIRAGQTFASQQGRAVTGVAFPNGRQLADDVTDVELSVLCNSGMPLGDGVAANDKPFLTTFPYVAAPWSGNP